MEQRNLPVDLRERIRAFLDVKHARAYLADLSPDPHEVRRASYRMS